MLEIPSYTLVDEGSERLWADFAKMVRDLEWTSTDNTVLWATPQLESTRCVFAKKNDDGSMLGCCVWNEHDGMAWIGFYMTLPSVQGAGLGSKIWAHALERIREKKQVIGLRAVSAMREKYASGATPVDVSSIKKHLLTVDQMKDFIARYEHPGRCLELYYEMHDDQREDLLRFDREITGRDRSEWLNKLFSSEESEVAVLFDDDGRVCAYSAISTVGHPQLNMFKIGPCYASSVAEFAAMAKWLVQWAEKYPPGARIIVGILTGSAGERELADVLGHRISDELVTLFSEEIETKMNLDKCYVPNNAHCHYDA
ncbi:hypothetical protein PRIPAC_80016 [Pristionchus pacificus]|uniref:N-acetyltransferase domain-containing protein n=1 Tax=Pristionchus pacificus TaxID=54126 RepID=A0A454XZR8_PRIPA|nr:hypothetical protein PRIPAC_80016 [Pristionchus pacificus]|eukprot:PDM78618.1 hypothetical protein PRIPAC_31197 [Pristionchus pacificus]